MDYLLRDYSEEEVVHMNGIAQSSRRRSPFGGAFSDDARVSKGERKTKHLFLNEYSSNEQVGIPIPSAFAPGRRVWKPDRRA
jgi:hypothetical protein